MSGGTKKLTQKLSQASVTGSSSESMFWGTITLNTNVSSI